MWLGRYSNNGTANYLYLTKSRSATVGTNTIVQSGDDLGTIAFYGADGTNLIQAASILGEVDGTPGTNDMPGRLVFSTTADGASTPTERLRIDSAGLLTLASGQIKFPASQNAAADANTLDDYEEGTFTPTILGTTTNPTVSYGRQDGRYVKIGMLVYASGSVVVNTITGGSGNLTVAGFPFTSRNTSEADRTAINFSYVSGFSSTTIPTSGIFNAGTTFAEMLVFNSADARAGRTSYVSTPPAAGFNIYYTCCYCTTT